MTVCIIHYKDELLTCWLHAWAFVDQSEPTAADKVTINREMTGEAQRQRAKGDGLGPSGSGSSPEESVWLHQQFFNYWCRQKTHENPFTQKMKTFPDLFCEKYTYVTVDIAGRDYCSEATKSGVFTHRTHTHTHTQGVCTAAVLSIQNLPQNP